MHTDLKVTLDFLFPTPLFLEWKRKESKANRRKGNGEKYFGCICSLNYIFCIKQDTYSTTKHEEIEIIESETE